MDVQSSVRPGIPDHPIELDVIASGSKGNAALVQCDGHVVMIDCGVTRKAFLQGCLDAQVDPAAIRCILITHEHSDHTKGLGVVLRALAKRNVHPTIYTLEGVFDAIPHVREIASLCSHATMQVDRTFSLDGFRIHAFPTSHDALSPVGFRFSSVDDALGYMTDSGYVSEQAHHWLRGCRILAIESNYDVDMLAHGPYPDALKRRIASNSGHLSNDQCAHEVASLATPRLQHVIAMHISENNNTYGEPVRAIEDALAQVPFHVDVVASSQRHSVIVR